uniref:SRCR domain-containing protein n=1 Tax=Plectus sambesii TaxID=2011161 RepID=A0A914XIM2_9BILA
MLLRCLCVALAMLCAVDAQPLETIKNVLGGVYSENITLFFMNSPYRVQTDLTVETGATMTIQTGVQLYFDAGVGLKIKGSLYAVGSKFARIQFLPHQSMLNYNYDFPKLRLVDGANVRQGRLQVLFNDRWRSVCTQQTNWTATDFSVACQSMGYGGGGFWRWFRRNNDTMPFVLPKPGCTAGSRTLWNCPGLVDEGRIPLSENLCQGEDDLGLYCWGPPSFSGWGRHWKGLQFLNIPFEYVNSDADQVSVHRQSLSRLEYVDIHYAGYDGTTKNSTAAIWIQGVPPFMNGLDVRRSARDGIFIYEATGPILIANSTIIYNRGHGIVVENTTDGRVFINETAVESNYGDGVWYRHKGGNQLQLILQSLSSDSTKWKRQTSYYEEERPRVEICRKHELPSDAFFPHLIRAFLSNGTLLQPEVLHPCWLVSRA